MTWDEHADGWDDDPAVRAYSSAAYESLVALLAERSLGLDGMRVLDFGCGTGLLTEALSAECSEVVSLDPSAKMIEVLRSKIAANEWSHVAAVEGTLEDALADPGAPLGDEFDLVVCSSVCAFLEDYPGTVRQLASLLVDGGVFMQFDWERDESDAEPFGLSRGEIDAALAQAGLDGVRVGIGFEKAVGEMVMKPLVGIGRRRVHQSRA